MGVCVCVGGGGWAVWGVREATSSLTKSQEGKKNKKNFVPLLLKSSLRHLGVHVKQAISVN